MNSALRIPIGQFHIVLLGLLCAAICAATWGAQAQASDVDGRTIQRIIEAGLPDAAIEFTKSRLSLSAGNPDAEARWVQRLMECYAQVAIRQGSRDAAMWQEISELRAGFAAEHPDNRRLPWLDWQAARCRFLQSQSGLASFLAAPANKAQRETVLVQVREILRLLSDLDDEVKLRLQTAAQEGLQGGREAPAEHLRQLRVDASLLRCESILVRSRLYEFGSKDRVAAASQLQSEAEEVLSRTDRSWASRPQLEIAHAAASLNLDRPETALATLAELAGKSPDSAIRASAAWVAIEYLCRDQEVSRASALLPALATSGPIRELAELEIALAEINDAAAERRESQMGDVINRAKLIGKRYGDYWRNRADALLVSAGGSAGSNTLMQGSETALKLIQVEVKQLLAAENRPLAIERLQGRLAIEMDAENAAAAMQLATWVAALEGEGLAWAAAADVLQEVSLKFSAEPDAAEMHQRSLLNLRNALAADLKNRSLLKRYESSLVEQLETWPNSPLSEPAIDWLGGVLAIESRQHELLPILLNQASLADSSLRFEAALWRWLIEYLSSSSQAQQATALAMLAEKSASAPGTQRAIWNLTEISATLLSRWPEEGDARELRSRLDTAARDLARRADDSPQTNWQQLATSMQLLGAARSRNLVQAVPLAREWTPSTMPSAIQLRLGIQLVQAVDFTDAAQHVDWSKVLKFDSAWAAVLREQPSAVTRAAGIRMLGWSGEIDQAVVQLESLRAKAPKDAGVLLQYATLLSEPGVGELTKSSSWASHIVKQTRPGTELHLAARWRLMTNMVLARKPAEAAKKAKLLLAISPPSDPVWRARFELLAQ